MVKLIQFFLGVWALARTGGLVLCQLLDVTQWWIVVTVTGSRWRWKKRIVRMKVQSEGWRGKYEKERDRRLALERELLQVRDRAQVITEMHLENAQGQAALLRDVMTWMGRVGTGFGVGDALPEAPPAGRNLPTQMSARDLAQMVTSASLKRRLDATESAPE